MREWRDSFRARFAPRPIPFIPQVGFADCGPAALTMSMRSLGIDVDENEVRMRARVGHHGTSAATIVRVARSFGVAGRGVRTGLDGLRQLGRGTILFWRFNHFVVLEAAYATGFVIVDPKAGRRFVSRKVMDESFTGVALEFMPTEDQVPLRTCMRSRWVEVQHFLPRWPHWLGAVTLSALLFAFTLILPLAMQLLVDSRGAAIGIAGIESWGTVLIASTLVAYGALQWLRGRVIVQLQATMERDSTRRLFLHLVRLPFSYFLTRHPAELGERLRTGSRLRDMLSVPIVSVVLDAVLVVAYIIAIWLQNTVLALVALGLIVALLLLVAFTWRRQSFLAADALDAHVGSDSVLQEVLENMCTVKCLGAEATVETRWQNAFAHAITASSYRERHLSAVSAGLATLQFGAPLIVLSTGIWQTVDDSLTLGQLFAGSMLAVTLFASLTSLAQTSLRVATLAPDLTRVRDILGQATEPSGAAMPPTGAQTTVSLRGVRFEYPGEKAPAVDDITFDIWPGDYVGILGASGSGKSTLADLIAGIEVPTGGDILIDGIDQAEAATVLRDRIGYVEQSTRLLSGSIIENVRLANPTASREEVHGALSMACADEFVDALPMGYETLLGHSGSGLSGGQRQRLALARALLKKPSLLILDEATNAVDPETEQRILRNVRATGCTLIVLGHRLNLVEQASRVLVLERGAIVAAGSPDKIRALRDTGALLL